MYGTEQADFAKYNSEADAVRIPLALCERVRYTCGRAARSIAACLGGSPRLGCATHSVAHVHVLPCILLVLPFCFPAEQTREQALVVKLLQFAETATHDIERVVCAICATDPSSGTMRKDGARIFIVCVDAKRHYVYSMEMPSNNTVWTSAPPRFDAHEAERLSAEMYGIEQVESAMHETDTLRVLLAFEKVRYT